MDIYIKIILFNHIIDNIDLKLNNSKENILKIGFKNVIISTLKIKYYQSIKGNNIKIHILPPTQRITPNILKRNI